MVKKQSNKIPFNFPNVYFVSKLNFHFRELQLQLEFPRSMTLVFMTIKFYSIFKPKTLLSFGFIARFSIFFCD